MNSKFKKLTIAVAAVLGLTASGALLAEQQFPTTQNAPATCDSVDWHKDILAQYPNVIPACREVVVAKDGSKWARFESVLEQIENDGTLNFSVQDTRGRRVGRISLMPGVDQVAYIQGRETKFRNIRSGQLLNLYVPEGGNAFATQAGVASSDLVAARPPVAATPIAAAPVALQFASVQFGLDSSVLTPETRQVLDAHARTLKDNPTANVLIMGHTSASATEAYNQSLSERRAKAVMDYLVSIPGVNASHLKMVGYGEMRPIAREGSAATVNSNEAKANMRVAFEVAAR